MVSACQTRMATHPRYLIVFDGSVFHVTWQCHNLKFLLEKEWVKQKYYDLLLKYKDRYGVTIFSYCFMSNHPHLSGHCSDKKLFSDFFRTINSQLARSYNRKVKRRGQMVMDRFKSPVIESQGELLKVMMYIDMNPKRACMVNHPQEYKWSSFAHYAYGKKDPLITEPECYLSLGKTPKDRQREYLKMVEYILKHDWKEKKNYSRTCFIGSPDWVKNRYIQLKYQIQNQRKKKAKVKRSALRAPP